MPGALGDLFAPAFIRGNPESEAAVAKWQVENFAVTPDMIEASRGPSTTITNPAVGGQFRAGGLGGGGTSTIPGSVDPEALQIYAQGGKYTPKPKPADATVTPADTTVTPDVNMQRDAIARTLLGTGRVGNNSPLVGLMGEGDQQGFMGGGYVDPDPFRIIPGGA